MKKIALLVLAGALLLGSGLGAESFKAGTAEWSPYAMTQNGKTVGIAVEILEQVAKLTGDTIDIKLYPAARLNAMFDNKELDINFADSPAWNEAKDPPTFIFTKDYTKVKEYLYFLSGQPLDVKKPEDLKGKTVGIVRDYYYAIFEDLFAKGIVKKEETDTPESLIQKLQKGRHEVAIFDTFLFDYLVKTFKFNPAEFKQGMEVNDSSIGFKVQIDKKKAVERFNVAIDKLKADGSIDKIIQKYIR